MSSDDRGFAQRVIEDREHFPWSYTTEGIICTCGRPCIVGENCAVVDRAVRWEHGL